MKCNTYHCNVEYIIVKNTGDAGDVSPHVEQQWLTGLLVSDRKEYISCHLEIDSSLHSDAGQYKVTLENKLGAASATINVKVIGT